MDQIKCDEINGLYTQFGNVFRHSISKLSIALFRILHKGGKYKALFFF